jgi:hypothetical protein
MRTPAPAEWVSSRAMKALQCESSAAEKRPTGELIVIDDQPGRIYAVSGGDETSLIIVSPEIDY